MLRSERETDSAWRSPRLCTSFWCGPHPGYLHCTNDMLFNFMFHSSKKFFIHEPCRFYSTLSCLADFAWHTLVFPIFLSPRRKPTKWGVYLKGLATLRAESLLTLWYMAHATTNTNCCNYSIVQNQCDNYIDVYSPFKDIETYTIRTK